MEKRFRATVYIDIWDETPQGASNQLKQAMRHLKIVAKESFSDGISELKHGSEVSLIDE